MKTNFENKLDFECCIVDIFYDCLLQIGSRSSVYSHTGRLRKSGSYIYEDFMPTDGTDVKVSGVNLEVVYPKFKQHFRQFQIYNFEINITSVP